MNWNDEEETPKKKMDLSSKILIGIIICVILIIALISVLLINIQSSTFKFKLDGNLVSKYSNDLIKKIDNTTYIEISEFSNLVGYEYHGGEEYKAFTKEKDKCYAKGKNETATFYLNDNKVCKLPNDKMEEDYREYTVENTVKEINNKMYASVDAIKIAFNVAIFENENSLTVRTLENLVDDFDEKVKSWGYTGISDQDFENQKSILYGYLIVKKENGLYKIIDTNNTKEIVSDKYNQIQFIESTGEFFVTNSLGKVGIINLDGTTKIEPAYDSIKVLDKQSDLYLVAQNRKFGVVKSGNTMVIYPEYDSIGLEKTNFENLESQYLIYNMLIPVCKDKKYGAFDKNGNLVYKIEYDGFGCEKTGVEINGLKKMVQPVLTIEKCKGVVLKTEEKYVLKTVDGKNLVTTPVDCIYKLKDETEMTQTEDYYMLYENKELNIIEQLTKAGLIKEENNMNNNNDTINNEITNNTINNNSIQDQVSSNNLISTNIAK